MSKEERFMKFQGTIQTSLYSLLDLWDEMGIEENAKDERMNTVTLHINKTLVRMIKEDTKAKQNIIDSLERHTRCAAKLGHELGVRYTEPDQDLSLIQLERAMRYESERLLQLKENNLRQVAELKRQDKELADKLGVEPFYVPSRKVLSVQQMEELQEHIRTLEDEKFVRLENFVRWKEEILKLYDDLEMEPETEMEREVACEESENFILSTDNMEQVSRILEKLQNQVKINQETVLKSMEKIDQLYQRLQMDMLDKFKFFEELQGYSSTVIRRLSLEIDRLEEIKKANIEKFVANLRDELHRLWDQCFFTEDQRNEFLPLHSTDFTEKLLEVHEAECQRLKEKYASHQDLYRKVAQWQEVWNKFIELEMKSKDPSRLMNAKGNSLLIEERERNKVHKTLPKLEKEIVDLIEEWEREKEGTFSIGGVNFIEYVKRVKEKFVAQQEAEKLARDQAKKQTLLHETHYGTKPVVTPSFKGSTSRMMSRIQRSVTAIKSPISGRIEKGASPRFRGKPTPKSVKAVAAHKEKLKRGVLANIDLSVIRDSRGQRNITQESVGYDGFREGSKMNSTRQESMIKTPKVGSTPRYLNPTISASNKGFKTPTTPSSRSMASTPNRTTSTSRLTLRSGRNLHFLF